MPERTPQIVVEVPPETPTLCPKEMHDGNETLAQLWTQQELGRWGKQSGPRICLRYQNTRVPAFNEILASLGQASIAKSSRSSS